MNTTQPQKILLNVSYQDTTQKYWRESYIKGDIVTIIDNNIHKTIASHIKEIDGVELLYNSKPQTNVFIDTKDGETKAIGYIYRGKDNIFNDILNKWVKVNFDIWVTIKSVSDYPIINLMD